MARPLNFDNDTLTTFEQREKVAAQLPPPSDNVAKRRVGLTREENEQRFQYRWKAPTPPRGLR